MEMFPLLMNVLALIAIVSGLALAAWFIVGFYAVHDRKQEDELPEISLPAHLHETISGIPPVLAMFYIFIAISMVFYVLFVWLGGITY